jgi:hypothetical protein
MIGKTNRSRRGNGGHAPGHIRDTFHRALEEYQSWNPGEAEPTVTYEVNYVPREITISQACGLVWNWSDIMPGLDFSVLENCGIECSSQTYAAAARALKSAIQNV